MQVLADCSPFSYCQSVGRSAKTLRFKNIKTIPFNPKGNPSWTEKLGTVALLLDDKIEIRRCLWKEQLQKLPSELIGSKKIEMESLELVQDFKETFKRSHKFSYEKAALAKQKRCFFGPMTFFLTNTVSHHHPRDSKFLTPPTPVRHLILSAQCAHPHGSWNSSSSCKIHLKCFNEEHGLWSQATCPSSSHGSDTNCEAGLVR